MKILIVEDDAVQAGLVADALRESDPPLESVWARSIAEVHALDAAFDAVLLDLNILDSRSLDTVIRARAITPAPIIVFSGEPGLGEEAVRAGADDYLIKGVAPFRAVHRSLLYAIERRRCAQQASERSDALKFEMSERSRIEGELRRSEARLRAIFENEPECVKIVSAEGRLLFMNPSGLTMIEAGSASEVVNQEISRFIHEDDRAAFLALHRRVVHGGSGELQFRIRGLAGTERWVETHSVPMREDDGTVSVLSVTRDITSRKVAEESLRRSEALLQIASRIGHVGAWRIELPSRRLTWSVEVHSILEVPREFVPDLDAGLSFYPPEYRDQIASVIQTCMKDGCAFDIEAQIVTARGRRVWVRVMGESDRGPDGSIIAVNGAFQDITIPKEAAERARLNEQARNVLEAALVHERGRLVDVFRQSPIFMCVLRGPSHIFEFANDAYFELVGGRPIIGKPVAEALPEVVDQGFVGLLDEVFTSGRPVVRYSTSILLARGDVPEERFVDFIYQPLVEADGTVSGIVAQGTDVTEKRRLEQRFFRVQRMESLGALAGGIAHDLNNLMMPILVGANLLRRPISEEQREKALTMVEQSAQRGGAFVKQILRFARGGEAVRQPVQLREVVHELELMIENTFPEDITLATDLDETLWLVDGDATQLHQVLLNLCVNARDAMPEGGRLSISATNAEVDRQYSVMHGGLVAGPYVLVTVADTGVGIEPAVVDRMFDPFFTTRELEKGTGLGLSTVATIVRRHGGTVTVRSEPKRGSAFAVYLPARGEVSEPKSTRRASMARRGSGELLLIADDDAAILTVLRETLESHGYRVLTAEDGAGAVALFQERRQEIALVLTDLQMPSLDGIALPSALRRIDPDVRILASSGVLVADAAALDAVESFEVLSKPYSADTLLAAVADVLHDRMHSATG